MQPSSCQIQMFGGLCIRCGEQLVTRFPTYKVGLLLARLAYPPTRPYSREDLIELLWPDVDAASGRLSLRQALTTLRRCLEPIGVAPGSLLIADRYRVQLAADAFTTDVAEFETLLACAARQENAVASTESLIRAAALYWGELLPDCQESWILAERRRLAETFIGIARQLAACYEEAGDLDQAIPYALRVVAADRLCEQSYAELMRLYAAAGDRSSAVHQYYELERALRVSVGEVPSPELRALAVQLGADPNPRRKRRSSPRAQVSPAEASPSYAEPSIPAAAPAPSVPVHMPSSPVGQPTRVQQQYVTLGRILHDTFEASPTEGTRNLAETLRAAAGERAAALAILPEGEHAGKRQPVPAQAEEEASLPVTPLLGKQPVAPSLLISAKHRLPLLLSLFLAIMALGVGFHFWKSPHSFSSHDLAAPAASSLPMAKWVYFYQPRVGEKLGSEGHAITTDASGIYVTGLIQTEKEDTDILTLKLSSEGKLLWVDRYSSPEHDCDRAFSLCLGGNGLIYVAGHTYVPQNSRDAGNWYLTLLCYTTEGRRLWVRRSPLPTIDVTQVQVSSDKQGGCYVGGTALVHGKQEAMLLRYEPTGRLLWSKIVSEGANSTFSQLAVSREGMLCFCGTAQVGESSNELNKDWMVACLNPVGQVQWLHLVDGPAHGNDTAGSILLDVGNNLLVAGVFDTGDPARGGQGLKLAIVKYSSDGTRLWQRIVKDTNPGIAIAGLSSNYRGDLAVGGTEWLSDGNKGIVLARYDTFGNSIQFWRYKPPTGYHSADLCSLSLLDSEQIQFLGRVSRSAAAFDVESSMLMGICNPDGALAQAALFEAAPHQRNLPYDYSHNEKGDFVFTGRAGLKDGHDALCVIAY